MACLGPETPTESQEICCYGEEEVEEVEDDDDEEELPKIAACRLVKRNDLQKIASLICCRTLKFFPDAERPIDIYEKSCLSLVQENENHEIVSAIFLCNYPNVPVLSQGDWLTWIHKLYNVKNSTEMNTLFIHFLVWDERYNEDFLSELLTETFYAATFCNYVIMVQPPGIPAGDPIDKTMTKIMPKNLTCDIEVQTLYVVKESQFIPALTYRLAVEEDNDDIVSLLDTQCSALRSRYGDYYVSEMMRHPKETRKLCVAERITGLAAVLCLTSDLDLDLLNHTFDLAAFGKLKKALSSPALSIDDGEEGECDYDDFCMVNYADESFECPIRRKGKKSEVVQPADAFAIELLGFASKIDEQDSRGLLAAGFDCFPNLNHCVILVPSERDYLPLLDQFTRVPLKADQDFPMSMYITHRSAIQGNFRTRQGHPSDYISVSRLVEGMIDAPYILHDFAETLGHENNNSNNERRSFLLICDDDIVGLAIVCAELESKLLCRYYKIEDLTDLVPKYPARLLRLVLVPVFQSKIGLFLTQILWMSQCDVLYKRIYNDMTDQSTSAMWSIEPRIRNWPQFQRYQRQQYPDTPFEELFSLYIAIPRLALTNKRIIDAKIVVVGASDCGIAFINALALGYKQRDIQFADVTLISDGGLPYMHTKDYYVRLMIPFKGLYSYAYRSLTPSKASYNVVTGTVIAIDRNEKCVRIENSGVLMYDYLILTCGMLFQLPEFEITMNGEENEWNSNTPIRAYTINDDYEAKRCLDDLKIMTENFTVEKSIVFLGCCLECYCALAACLELGLSATWITLIEPNDDSTEDIFEDEPEVGLWLREIMEAKGVRILRPNGIDTVIIGSDGSMRILMDYLDCEQVDCDALVCFDVKRPCLKTFNAITQAGLVFDGRLVIDTEFRTNDNHVLAAGTFSRRTRKPHTVTATTACHEPEHHHSSIEVGEKLAEKFINMIKEVNDDDNENEEKWISLEPRIPGCSYKKPIVHSCMLPKGYYYLRVRRPGSLNRESEESAKRDVLTTGSCTADIGYFRIQFNQFSFIESITCLRKKDFDIQNIISLYGKHEAMLNDLKIRYLNSEIPDFFAYFEKPWVTALFHDHFDDLRKESQEIILNTALRGSKSQISLKNGCLIDKNDNSKELEEILNNWQKQNYHPTEIEDAVSGFIEHHEDDLPMYLTLHKKNQLIYEIEALKLPQNDDSEEQFIDSCSCSQEARITNDSCSCSSSLCKSTSLSISTTNSEI